MADRAVATVTRTVVVSDLTPAEMASIFAQWDSDQQAAFFDALKAEAADWPGMGWCGQAMSIVDKLGDPGFEIVAKLADWLKSRAEQEGRVI